MATTAVPPQTHYPIRHSGNCGGRTQPPAANPNPNVCVYWLQGRCTRSPCKFLHPDLDHQSTTTTNPSNTLCKFWASPSSTCAYGHSCRFLHAWHSCVDHTFSMKTRLVGHGHPVAGIAIPPGSNLLYTAAKDGSVKVWDCHTGKPDCEVSLGTRAACMASEGSWVFIGQRNAVAAWRVDDQRVKISLNGPVGQVTALSTSDDTLFAGSEDGSIHAWRFINNDNGGNFQTLTPLEGHGRPVACLRVGAGQLFSGCVDGTIQVYDLNDLRCLQTLKAHNGAVSSLICWDKFLLSSSMDGKVHVWGATEAGDLRLVYKHQEEAGVVSLFGMVDMEAKPVLYCSCKDRVVRLYDLPSFRERGRIFANEEVGSIQQGPDGLGLFFTGDGTGVVSVWQWARR